MADQLSIHTLSDEYAIIGDSFLIEKTFAIFGVLNVEEMTISNGDIGI